jgi:2-oxoglutarate dehydrogenase E2 component (dihydrolipoamide succinyltransferase)
MATTTDPEEIARLYGELSERILAKDKEGTIEVYYELLRLGRPLAEIMARAERAEDSPPPGAAELAGEAPAKAAGATLLDEPPTPASVRPEPAPERLAERASVILGGRPDGAPDWAINRVASGETSPVPGDTANQLPLSDAASAPPTRSLPPIARLGFAVCAIVVVVGIGALLLRPAVQNIVAGGSPAGETTVAGGAGTSPSADAPATPPASGAAASDSATRGNSTAEPRPAPAPSSGTAPPPAEPAPSAQPVPEAPQPDTTAAATEPARTAAPAEPAPAARPGVAAPTPATPRPAAAEIAALRTRGDGLLGVGDITSARLFYERASDAGDGRAALRLGATYDPGFLDRVHLPHQYGDVAQALSWYRRARDLGESDAELWMKGLDTRSAR